MKTVFLIRRDETANLILEGTSMIRKYVSDFFLFLILNSQENVTIVFISVCFVPLITNIIYDMYFRTKMVITEFFFLLFFFFNNT